jgi:hypothetical protein
MLATCGLVPLAMIVTGAVALSVTMSYGTGREAVPLTDPLKSTRPRSPEATLGKLPPCVHEYGAAGALAPTTLAPKVMTAPMSCASGSVAVVEEGEEDELVEEDEPDPVFEETEPLELPDMRACSLPE